MNKKDEVYQIISFTTPPSQMLEWKHLLQYYLGFFKNVFEKRGYEVKINFPVKSGFSNDFLDLVAWKLDESVGIEFSEGKGISNRSIKKFQILNLKNWVFIVKSGSFEENSTSFLNNVIPELNKKQKVYFKSLDYLVVLSHEDIMTKIKELVLRNNVKSNKITDFMW